MHEQAEEHEIRFLLIMFIDKKHFKKGNMGQRNFRKPFEFHNFSEIFYYGMTSLRNKNLGAFIKCEYTRTILRNKNTFLINKKSINKL